MCCFRFATIQLYRSHPKDQLGQGLPFCVCYDLCNGHGPRCHPRRPDGICNHAHAGKGLVPVSSKSESGIFMNRVRRGCLDRLLAFVFFGGGQQAMLSLFLCDLSQNSCLRQGRNGDNSCHDCCVPWE